MGHFAFGSLAFNAPLEWNRAKKARANLLYKIKWRLEILMKRNVNKGGRHLERIWVIDAHNSSRYIECQ